MNEIKLLAIVPHYRHLASLPTVLSALQTHDLPILVVDDGSGEAYQTDLQKICEQYPRAQLCRLPENGGKGAAMKQGFQIASTQGYSHVLQIDADAQHQLNDIARFIAAATHTPQAAICGNPIYGDDAPKSRLYGRQITNFWNKIHTASHQIKDGMCGFRIYPLPPTMQIMQEKHIGQGMDFDNEILIHLYWRDVPLIWLDTMVKYQADGVSHFRMWQDNVLISKMHSRLFFQMLAKQLGWRK